MGNLRVLVVDDSKISRVMIAENLRDTDFEVCGMAADAAEAVRLYEELRPDAVTMDMNLPDANGLECSRRIIIMDPDANIVMASAMKDLNLITQGKAIGIRAFLQKPIAKQDLVDALHLLCEAGENRLTTFRELYAKPFARALQEGTAGLLRMEGTAEIEEYEPRHLDVSGAAVIIGITGFTTVMPMLGFPEPTRTKLYAASSRTKSLGVSVLVGFTKQIRGNVVYNMSEDTAKFIASTMMMGMPVEAFDEMAQSAISELSNMLTANTATNITGLGLDVDISTPSLTVGSDFEVKISDGQYLVVEMDLSGKLVELDIAVDQN